MLRGNNIPQLERFPDDSEFSEGLEVDFVDWHYFLAKAAKGSCKAVDALEFAIRYFLVTTTNDALIADKPLEEYYRPLQERLGIPCPWKNGEEAVEDIGRMGWFDLSRGVSDIAPEEVASYQDLWRKGTSVNVQKLKRDAIQSVLAEWGWQSFHTRLDHLDGLNYNSLDVVACMIMLAMVWPENQTLQ